MRVGGRRGRRGLRGRRGDVGWVMVGCMLAFSWFVDWTGCVSLVLIEVV